ncbi:polyribonucleotide nucleotidyltransferase [Bacteroidia bacterium]|nr:polyribonucleotide nucleotidyltransferase [Bacteroidia bacterium]
MTKNIGVSHSISLRDGVTIEIETGKLAKQAHGSVVLKQGKTMLLATVVSNFEARTGVDFLPLSVDYQEKFAAVGRIPGSFHKREARLTDYEVLICRIVDRALRPLFPKDYHADIQVMISLISADENILPDALAGLAASAAIMLSDLPFEGPISEARVGRVNGNLVINPTAEELKDSDIDIIIAGTERDINMVEGEMKEISEADMIEALKFGHGHIKDLCKFQHELVEKNGGRKPTREYNHEDNDDALAEEVMSSTYDKVLEVAKMGGEKKVRSAAFAEIRDSFIENYSVAEGEDVPEGLIKKYFHKVEKKAMRDMVLDHNLRLDGRALNQVRPIWSEVDYLPSAHGSSVFTRGETQALTTVTLGSKTDEQLLDSPMVHGYSNLMLHYNFPAFSTGEARPNRGTSRREVGHGNLALRGIRSMLPDESPYTIRIVADVLESNGSSSMATVCSGSMALMDAGVKMNAGVSGIAMGLIAEGDRAAILSDILGDEDHLGDMDFKVIGTRKGIVACQMDMKIDGLSYDLLAKALAQSTEGRLHILEEMEKTISETRPDFKPHTPRVEMLTIEKEFIGAVIGPGGKIIQEMQAETGATINIEEVDGFGKVQIMSDNADSLNAALAKIKAIVAVPEVGGVYDGKVKNVVDFGAFVEFMPGKEGLLHISEISWERLPSMEGVLKEGDAIQVKLTEVDKRSGKYRLSKKVLTEKPGKEESSN